MKNDVPSWGSNQGRHGNDYRKPMTRSDADLVIWLAVTSSVITVGIIAALFQVFS
jgi:hypothetical protein